MGSRGLWRRLNAIDQNVLANLLKRVLTYQKKSNVKNIASKYVFFFSVIRLIKLTQLYRTPILIKASVVVSTFIFHIVCCSTLDFQYHMKLLWLCWGPTISLRGLARYGHHTVATIVFSMNWPLGRFSHKVAMSICVYVCLSVTS